MLFVTRTTISILILFLISCVSPPPKVEKVVVPEKKIEKKETVQEDTQPKTELAFLESIEDGRNIPSSGNWTAEQYNSFNEQTFFSYEPAKQTIDFQNFDYPLLHAAIFYTASKERRKLGMKAFKYSSLCEQAAFGHAQDMVKYDFYSHTSKVTGKETLRDRLELVGLVKPISGENIISAFALDYKPGTPLYTPDQNTHKKFSYTRNGPPIPNHTYISLADYLVETWMNAPAQRRNILNPDFSYLGTGAYYYQDAKFQNIDRVKAVMVFSSKP
ncbi:cysteine-rich secretory family protein [Leptospira ryugenii]|uniref:Cysteine-rich secretory family protein n=1 Tax=Leptospira ryugenii TaxID=1917863 RepID=A0A2P2E2Q5_9LEPT|nr:CAP domain-containing protein [Leptospira ryugenii]GBF51134.1 cysteine-rich secretory family protein [Leptospira ryugenii]